MGFLRSINDLQKQAKEIDRNWDVKAQGQNVLSRMAAAQEMMAEQTRAANLAQNGLDATVSVVAATKTTAQINFDPVIEFELTVFPDGRPPYPLTLRQLVSQLYLAKVQPGATLKAKVDANDPSAVWLDLVQS